MPTNVFNFREFLFVMLIICFGVLSLFMIFAIDKKIKKSFIPFLCVFIIVFGFIGHTFLKSNHITETTHNITNISINQTVETKPYRKVYRLKLILDDGTELITNSEIFELKYTIGDTNSCIVFENGLHMKTASSIVFTQDTVNNLHLEVFK